METIVKTIAKTKKGNFDVTAKISINEKTGISSEHITCTVDNEDYELFLNSKSDRVNISDDLANKFGVKNDTNIVLACDCTQIISGKKRLRKEWKAAKYDGRIIDSGYGFKMKNTFENNMLCVKHGFDAIEMVK